MLPKLLHNKFRYESVAILLLLGKTSYQQVLYIYTYMLASLDDWFGGLLACFCWSKSWTRDEKGGALQPLSGRERNKLGHFLSTGKKLRSKGRRPVSRMRCSLNNGWAFIPSIMALSTKANKFEQKSTKRLQDNNTHSFNLHHSIRHINISLWAPINGQRWWIRSSKWRRPPLSSLRFASRNKWFSWTSMTYPHVGIK